jgi:hypothetical protein
MCIRKLVSSLFRRSSIDLHQFRTTAVNGHQTFVVQGDSAAVEKFISRGELEDFCGGYVIHIDKHGAEYLGVSSVRTCSRFRRILRERGAELTVWDMDPNEMSISIVATKRPVIRSFKVSPRRD